ncbi:MAG: hypothetical protein ACOYID_00565 [Eubacteriales bacterium]|jgi:hypothetical protein|nr:hypothetical protein [Clostridiales bacterium]
MGKKRYKIKNRKDAYDIIPRESQKGLLQSAQNAVSAPKLETLSELDSYPELSVAETLDFAEASDSTP